MLTKEKIEIILITDIGQITDIFNLQFVSHSTVGRIFQELKKPTQLKTHLSSNTQIGELI